MHADFTDLFIVWASANKIIIKQKGQLFIIFVKKVDV